MTGVLHHIKNPELFFKDAERVLVAGGRVVMIEPTNNAFARFMYKISHHEPFDADAEWKILSDKHLAGANLALPWIIFIRDHLKYNLKFPNLKVYNIRYHNSLTFQISGAGAYNTFLPGFTFPLFKLIEKLISPFYKSIAMWMTIELEKC